ncbi:probable gluconokinase isoform X2 [Anabas testudineus]|uniref:gluconokinase n=1 Tax=Anabas testudineus TaxID=64144 RepID=A0A3Q1JZ11_ANATE|nr:probable gluconokinase isoform X2 [Anabas testudineus]
MIYIIMGVAGCGKRTSYSLARVLPLISWAGPFTKGITTTHRRTLRKCLVVKHSQIRLPWLLKLHEIIQRERSSGCDALVVCSALKRLYRQILLYGSKALTASSSPDQEVPSTSPDVFFLFLHGDYELIYQRMVARKGHYMKADLLRSQFDILEPPLDDENVLSLDIRKSVAEMFVEVEKHIISFKSSPAML